VDQWNTTKGIALFEARVGVINSDTHSYVRAGDYNYPGNWVDQWNSALAIALSA
jgi:hypothetical protein